MVRLARAFGVDKRERDEREGDAFDRELQRRLRDEKRAKRRRRRKREKARRKEAKRVKKEKRKASEEGAQGASGERGERNAPSRRRDGGRRRPARDGSKSSWRR